MKENGNLSRHLRWHKWIEMQVTYLPKGHAWSLVNGWYGRWLTEGGNKLLLRPQLPTYVMSSFLLSLEICEKLASAITCFWWNKNSPYRGMHWPRWEKLCCPKYKGGIGFRLIHKFNLALFAKQLWRMIQFLDSLLARVLRGWYNSLCLPLRET